MATTTKAQIRGGEILRQFNDMLDRASTLMIAPSRTPQRETLDLPPALQHQLKRWSEIHQVRKYFDGQMRVDYEPLKREIFNLWARRAFVMRRKPPNFDLVVPMESGAPDITATFVVQQGRVNVHLAKGVSPRDALSEIGLRASAINTILSDCVGYASQPRMRPLAELLHGRYDEETRTFVEPTTNEIAAAQKFLQWFEQSQLHPEGLIVEVPALTPTEIAAAFERKSEAVLTDRFWREAPRLCGSPERFLKTLRVFEPIHMLTQVAVGLSDPLDRQHGRIVETATKRLVT